MSEFLTTAIVVVPCTEVFGCFSPLRADSMDWNTSAAGRVEYTRQTFPVFGWQVTLCPQGSLVWHLVVGLVFFVWMEHYCVVKVVNIWLTILNQTDVEHTNNNSSNNNDNKIKKTQLSG